MTAHPASLPALRWPRLRARSAAGDAGPGAGISWPAVAALSAVLAATAAAPAAMVAVFAALVAMALAGARTAVVALALSSLLLFLNPGIWSVPGAAMGLRWLVLLAAFGRVTFDVLRRRVGVPTALAPVGVYVAVVLVLALTASWQPLVSTFKVVSFGLGASTLLLAVREPGVAGWWERWLRSAFVAIVAWSAPLLALPVGRLRNEQGFQGIFDQPQAFAIVMAPLIAWLTGALIFGRRLDVVTKCALAGGWVMLFASLARTALASIALGFVIAATIGAVAGGPPRAALARLARRRATWAAGALLLPLLALSAGALQAAALEFLLKGDTDASVGEGFYASRGFLIIASFDNFLDRPWTGIGFGVPTDPGAAGVTRDAALGVPLAASSEKGFLPSAVLEETGIVGTAALLVLLAALSRRALRAGDLPSLWLFWAAFVTNLGEMTFFSFGGLGRYIWLLLALATTAAAPAHGARAELSDAR